MKCRKNIIENGYVLKRKLLDVNEIDACLKSIGNLPPKLLVPFSNEAWGFGSLKDISPFENILQKIHTELTDMNLFESQFLLNHLVCNRKPAWIGPEVEYHQEVFNHRTFASGASPEYVRNNWVQVYLPLHDEKAENGGLRILSNTHKLGQLSYQDIISPNFGHKRRVDPAVLDSLSNSDEHSLLDLNLNAGDCLFFSTYLVHSSPSNGTENERLSLVSQARPIEFVPDQKIFDEETAFRRKFVSDQLTKICDANRKTEKYTEFNNKK